MLLVGIDIGTTSICCLLIEADTGRRVRISARANDSGLVTDHAWERCQDPERIMDIVHELIAELEGDWARVSAIGISCQMHGIVYANSQGHAVSPLYTWQDQRGALPLSESQASASEEIKAITKHTVPAGYGWATHYYNIVQGLVPAEAATLCTIGDYVAMKLCRSTEPLMDVSNAAGLGMFDLSARAFDKSALEAIGIKPSMMPNVTDRIQTVGMTVEGIPVACAIGDNQASFIGAVPALEHTSLVNFGTGAQLSVFSKKLLQTAELETRPFPGGGYLLVGASLGGGKTYALLASLFQDICKQFTQVDVPLDQLYARMNQLAEEALFGDTALGESSIDDFPIEGSSEDLFTVHPQFFGTRTNPDATGAMVGLRDMHFTTKHWTAAFQEGMINELLSFRDALPAELREQAGIAAASGNGLRKNRALRWLLEKKLGLPLYLAKVEEEAAFGAAIYAGAACGKFADIDLGIRTMQRSVAHD